MLRFSGMRPLSATLASGQLSELKFQFSGKNFRSLIMQVMESLCHEIVE